MSFKVLVEAFLFAAGFIYYFPHVSFTAQDKTEKRKQLIILKAKGRGTPSINFADGTEIKEQNPKQNNSQPTKLISADFDSDGTPDLITADAFGNFKFYRGNTDAIYPFSSEANERKAAGNFIDAAFYQSEKGFHIPLSPDFLVTGDFNLNDSVVR